MVHLPVCRVGKIHRTGRTTCKSVMAHLARTRPTKNADPNRTQDNVWLVGDAESDLRAEIDAVFKKLGIKPRLNAVLANDIVLTISPAWFIKEKTQGRPIWDRRRIETIKRVALAFAKKTVRLTCSKGLAAPRREDPSSSNYHRSDIRA